MKRYHFITILIVMVLFVNCSVNDPEITANKEYFIGSWKSNALLERIDFTATDAKWFINYKKDTTALLDTNSNLYDIYDSTYLVKHFEGWELYSDKSRIDFLDTFTLSSGQTGNGASIFEYSIKSENSFYLMGIDSEPIFFARD